MVPERQSDEVEEFDDMPVLDAEPINGKVLEDYDRMMIEANYKVAHFSALAASIWADVLRELDKRGSVTLVSGSYDDAGRALITRNY